MPACIPIVRPMSEGDNGVWASPSSELPEEGPFLIRVASA